MPFSLAQHTNYTPSPTPLRTIQLTVVKKSDDGDLENFLIVEGGKWGDMREEAGLRGRKRISEEGEKRGKKRWN